LELPTAEQDQIGELAVDHTRFETFTKRLATTPLTRAQALRGLVASAAALTGVQLSAQPGSARKKDKKEGKVCVCSGAAEAGCRTQNKDATKVKKLLRQNPCAYKGRCTSVNPCAPAVPGPIPECMTNAQCTGGLVCVNQTCQTCTSYTQCSNGQMCLEGRCRGGEACNLDAECARPLICKATSVGNRRCLLSDLGNGECPPLLDGVCGPYAGAPTFCVLASCAVGCDERCQLLSGECLAGICFYKV
jgi:hypothetical protein